MAFATLAPVCTVHSMPSAPVISVQNYTVCLTEAESIKYIRFALGTYKSASEIKNAADCVTLNSSVISVNTANGVFSYEMPNGGIYSFWVKTDSSEYIFSPVDMTFMTPEIVTDGVTITVKNVYGASDLFIAKGTWNSYPEIKSNGYIVRATSNKLSTLKNYSYTVKDPGDYTVLVRYNGREWYKNFNIYCITPTYSGNGLQLTVGNLEGVKVIRTACGKYTTISAMKKSDTHKAFTAKGVLKDQSEYTIQLRNSGIVTVAVQYENGYYEFYEYNAVQKTPTISQDNEKITFGDLDGLKLIRYAKGEYTTSKEIKYAPDSRVIKYESALNGYITVTLDPGIYSFCVQYDDESYNYYTFTVTDKEKAPAVFSKQYRFTDAQGNTVSTLPYWLYTPADATEGMPLIVVLHSAHVKSKNELTAEANLDNMVSSADDLPKFIYNGEFGNIPAYIVMPQTSGASRGWAKRGAELKELVGFCQREYGIDSGNVSIMGYSLGGTGAIEVASAYPETFTRVFSAAGGLDGVTNNSRPYIEGTGRLDINTETYKALRVLKENSTTEYEKETMKYQYAASGNKYLTITKEEIDAAKAFEIQRITEIAGIFNNDDILVWTVVGDRDTEVAPSVSAELCDTIGSNKAKCDVIEDCSHAGAISYCLEIKSEIISFLLNE